MEKIYKIIAQELRNEMVCCDTYDKLAEFFGESEYRALKRSSNYHAICHYGEWAARIVEDMGREDRRESHEPL